MPKIDDEDVVDGGLAGCPSCGLEAEAGAGSNGTVSPVRSEGDEIHSHGQSPVPSPALFPATLMSPRERGNSSASATEEHSHTVEASVLLNRTRAEAAVGSGALHGCQSAPGPNRQRCVCFRWSKTVLDNEDHHHHCRKKSASPTGEPGEASYEASLCKSFESCLSEAAIAS